MMMALSSLCGLVGLILWIYGIVWIYNDAQSRGESPILWAILTFFFSGLVLLIYGLMKSAQRGLILGVLILALGLFQGFVGFGAIMAAMHGAHVTSTAAPTSP